MKKPFLLLSIILFCSQQLKAQVLPYQNPELNPQERASDLLSRLTLEEKVGLMGDHSNEVTRLGVKKFAW